MYFFDFTYFFKSFFHLFKFVNLYFDHITSYQNGKQGKQNIVFHSLKVIFFVAMNVFVIVAHA